jgi:Protein of unknown function (DUF1553)
LSASPTITRRTVYGFVNRDIVSNLMSTFDAANPNACTAKRPETNVPQQTLFALNSEFIQERAAKIAELTASLGSQTAEARIAEIYRRILVREPNQQETQRAKEFLFAEAIQVTVSAAAGSSEIVSGTSNPSAEQANPSQSRWAQLAHALMASNEFLFLD